MQTVTSELNFWNSKMILPWSTPELQIQNSIASANSQLLEGQYQLIYKDQRQNFGHTECNGFMDFISCKEKVIFGMVKPWKVYLKKLLKLLDEMIWFFVSIELERALFSLVSPDCQEYIFT